MFQEATESHTTSAFREGRSTQSVSHAVCARDSSFHDAPKRKVAQLLLRPDLKAARKKWLSETIDDQDRADRETSNFLREVDGAGRYADLHALRHAFITNVGRTGAHFKTTQDLARHSDPRLAARYTHGFKDDKVVAIKALPDLSQPGPEPAGATGTDDATVGGVKLSWRPAWCNMVDLQRLLWTQVDAKMV